MEELVAAMMLMSVVGKDLESWDSNGNQKTLYVFEKKEETWYEILTVDREFDIFNLNLKALK